MNTSQTWTGEMHTGEVDPMTGQLVWHHGPRFACYCSKPKAMATPEPGLSVRAQRWVNVRHHTPEPDDAG